MTFTFNLKGRPYPVWSRRRPEMLPVALYPNQSDDSGAGLGAGLRNDDIRV